MLKAGIVGLPNVGKSTLFNACVHAHKAPAENYPFCTIDANLGVVAVPDPRLEPLRQLAKVSNAIPAAVEFVDIAGLVRGASRGEGLGNKFLSHIREVDALVHVVRCFENPDIAHVTGSIDPVRDIEIVTTELVLADLERVKKKREKILRDVKKGDKQALAEEALLQRLEPHLNAGHPANTLQMAHEERQLARTFFLLTDKPTLLVANLKEDEMAGAGQNPFVSAVRDYVQAHQGCDTLALSAQLESDLIDLSPDEAAEYLEMLGLKDLGSAAVIQHTYQLLGLRTFFTHNDNEVRAWTVHAGDTAPKAAGVIHSDFEHGFIKAETVHYEELMQAGSFHAVREKGFYRQEGKDYVVQDGDVLLFKFHV